jgi:hypothetical protein
MDVLMPNLNEAILDLSQFSDEIQKIAYEEGSSNLITDLSSFSTPEKTPDELIEKVRKKLKRISLITNLQKNGITLAQAAHRSLLALSQFKPINAEDPITSDAIEADDVIYTSTGHQFSLTNLIHYHNVRDYRGAQLGEQANSKWLLNPITNDKFDLMDVAHIQAAAQQKGIEIQHLRKSSSTPAPAPAPSVVTENVQSSQWTARRSAPYSNVYMTPGNANSDLRYNNFGLLSQAELATTITAFKLSIGLLSTLQLGVFQVEIVFPIAAVLIAANRESYSSRYSFFNSRRSTPVHTNVAIYSDCSSLFNTHLAAPATLNILHSPQFVSVHTRAAISSRWFIHNSRDEIIDDVDVSWNRSMLLG